MMRVLFLLVGVVLLTRIAAAQKFEVFTGDQPAMALPRAKAVDYLAKCLTGHALSCAIFKSQTSAGGLEAGDIEQTEYVGCNKRGGVCLELATLDLDEKDAPKQRLPSIDIKILFDYDRASLKSSETAKLARIAKALNDPASGDSRFALIGHTDSKGTQSYNCRLSAQRARSVAKRLAALGVAPDRLVTIGAGEYVLRDRQNSEAAQNRRVGFARLDEEKGEIIARLKKLCDSK